MSDLKNASSRAAFFGEVAMDGDLANEGALNEQTRGLRMKGSVEPKKLLQVFAIFFNGSSIQTGSSPISSNLTDCRVEHGNDIISRSGSIIFSGA